jgi:dihydroneopterin aldolase
LISNHIFLHGLKVKTKIGVPDWERIIVQELIIDVDITLKDKHIFKSDDISQTIDYAQVEVVIKEISDNHNYHLLESFGEEIITKLQDQFSFASIKLKIAKQKILPNTDFVGVLLER